MSAAKSKNRSLLVRRIIAIVLSIGAVVGLFLPMLSIGEDAQDAFRRIKTEDGDSYIAFLSDLPRTLTRILKEGEAEKKHIRALSDIVSELVEDVALPLYGTGEDHQITFLETCQIAGIPSDAVDVLKAHEDELDDLVEEYNDSEPEYEESVEALQADFNAIKPLRNASKITSMVLYGLFFVTLALGVLSIILEACNQSKGISVLFCVLAFLCAALFAALIVVPRVMVDALPSFNFDFEGVGKPITKIANASVLAATTLLPGIGLIMLPICSLAACIVYKRDKYRRKAVPQRTADAPSAELRRPKKAERPQEQKPQNAAPANEPYWTCPNCGQINELSARFCIGCGVGRSQKQPASQEQPPAKRFCPLCGFELMPNSRFCPGCGVELSRAEEPSDPEA